jgi:hypothetical protein
MEKREINKTESRAHRSRSLTSAALVAIPIPPIHRCSLVLVCCVEKPLARPAFRGTRRSGVRW